jgi:alkylated DNA repair dioxygenase AlkB
VSDNLLPQDGSVVFFSDFFDTTHSDRLLDELTQTIYWQQTPIILFGKKIMQPRLTAWYGDENARYRYSGTTMTPLPWNQLLLDIKSAVEQKAGTTFNSVLLNLYRDHNDSMGYHRDNEKELGNNPVIASISLGATRTFHLKHVDYPNTKTLKRTLNLTHGSLLIMSGTTQHYWNHAIPKTKKTTLPRINLTFRTVLDT